MLCDYNVHIYKNLYKGLLGNMQRKYSIFKYPIKNIPTLIPRPALANLFHQQESLHQVLPLRMALLGKTRWQPWALAASVEMQPTQVFLPGTAENSMVIVPLEKPGYQLLEFKKKKKFHLCHYDFKIPQRTWIITKNLNLSRVIISQSCSLGL